jgi:guanylate kinase
MDYPGNLFVVAAPSGAGKSSLVKALMELDSRVRPRCRTPRAPRAGRKSTAASTFSPPSRNSTPWCLQRLCGMGPCARSTATAPPKRPSKSALPKGQRRGAGNRLPGRLQVKQTFANAVLIFILPPSWEELRSRLERRGEDSPSDRTAPQECRRGNGPGAKFDFVIINELFERALFDLKAIVHAQRLKYAAQRRARADTFESLNIS